MILLLLILVPTLAGALAFALRNDRARRALWLAAALAHAGLTMLAWRCPPAALPAAWLALDPLGLLFLGVTSLLFLSATFYGLHYVAAEAARPHEDNEEGFIFTNAPEARFTGCLLLFLATMTLVVLLSHMALIWVAIEATTLVTAPLIYFHRHHRSLEAAWKYLLVCSVGIGIALLGIFFLAMAAPPGTQDDAGVLGVARLVAAARTLNPVWLKAAFVLLLVGYGTKMGLAPMHTWLPDAHSEAPSVVSSLLSGALLNCAFLGLLRVQQVLVAAGLAGFSRDMFLALGLFSVAVAAFFIIRQSDFKRLLAYSSVEHMGILAIGVGIGGAGVFGSLLHAANHSLVKCALFMCAGNLMQIYGSKSTLQVRGALQRVPGTALLWLLGFFAITGTPPFGVFVSKFVILKAALDAHQHAVAAVLFGLLVVIFAGMAAVVLPMVGSTPGPTRPTAATPPPLGRAPVVVPALLLLGALVLGLYVPPWLQRVLQAAAETLGGGL